MTEDLSTPSFYLALPSYNEGERLAQFLPGLCAAISKSDLRVKIQIVDDGSDYYHQGHYRSLMDLLQSTFPFLKVPLVLEPNRGKGGAVYAGWAQGGDADMLAFADADGAVGPSEILRVFEQISRDPHPRQTLYAASRIEDATTQVKRRAIRNIGGLTFRWLRKQLFSFPIEDTQCGFKIVPNHFFKTHRPLLAEGGFAFDIELLYRAQQAGLKLQEIPVTWEDKKGGHMTLGNSLGLFKDLLKLKGRLDKEV